MYANSSVPQSLSRCLTMMLVLITILLVFIPTKVSNGSGRNPHGPNTIRWIILRSSEELDYDNEDNSPGYYAQSVQRSAFPPGTIPDMPRSNRSYNRYGPQRFPEDDMASVPQGEWDEIRIRPDKFGRIVQYGAIE